MVPGIGLPQVDNIAATINAAEIRGPLSTDERRGAEEVFKSLQNILFHPGITLYKEGSREPGGENPARIRNRLVLVQGSDGLVVTIYGQDLPFGGNSLRHPIFTIEFLTATTPEGVERIRRGRSVADLDNPVNTLAVPFTPPTTKGSNWSLTFDTEGPGGDMTLEVDSDLAKPGRVFPTPAICAALTNDVIRPIQDALPAPSFGKAK